MTINTIQFEPQRILVKEDSGKETVFTIADVASCRLAASGPQGTALYSCNFILKDGTPHAFFCTKKMYRQLKHEWPSHYPITADTVELLDTQTVLERWMWYTLLLGVVVACFIIYKHFHP